MTSTLNKGAIILERVFYRPFRRRCRYRSSARTYEHQRRRPLPEREASTNTSSPVGRAGQPTELDLQRLLRVPRGVRGSNAVAQRSVVTWDRRDDSVQRPQGDPTSRAGDRAHRLCAIPSSAPSLTSPTVRGTSVCNAHGGPLCTSASRRDVSPATSRLGQGGQPIAEEPRALRGERPDDTDGRSVHVPQIASSSWGAKTRCAAGCRTPSCRRSMPISSRRPPPHAGTEAHRPHAGGAIACSSRHSLPTACRSAAET